MSVIQHIMIWISILMISTVVFCFLDAGHFRGINPATDHGTQRVLNRLYFSTNTCSTIGYGDIVPTSVAARTICFIISASIYMHIIHMIRSHRDE